MIFIINFSKWREKKIVFNIFMKTNARSLFSKRDLKTALKSYETWFSWDSIIALDTNDFAFNIHSLSKVHDDDVFPLRIFWLSSSLRAGGRWITLLEKCQLNLRLCQLRPFSLSRLACSKSSSLSVMFCRIRNLEFLLIYLLLQCLSQKFFPYYGFI